MKRSILVAVPLLLLLIVAAIIRADDAPTTAPAAPPPARKAVKVDKPWNGLSNLTDDQRQQIHDIHVQFLKDFHELQHKETADIMALLTDEQKQELADILAKNKQHHNAKADAATQPATEKSPK